MGVGAVLAAARWGRSEEGGRVGGVVGATATELGTHRPPRRQEQSSYFGDTPRWNWIGWTRLASWKRLAHRNGVSLILGFYVSESYQSRYRIVERPQKKP